MRSILAACLAFQLSGCINSSISQTVYAYTLFDSSTVGGPNYPIVIHGSDMVGLSPAEMAQRLRFPAGSGFLSNSTFRAVDENGPIPVNHAYLDVTPKGDRAKSTMTFYHGRTKIGLGSFSLPREQYSNPEALGNVSATLLLDMLRTARAEFRDDDNPWWFY